MKKFVINLERRKDRKEKFKELNPDFDVTWFEGVDGSLITYKSLRKGGFDTDKSWRDPILKSTITRGEIGCALSHYFLWQKCIELDEPIIIFEDDAIINRTYDDDYIEELCNDKHLDFIYLGYREMSESGGSELVGRPKLVSPVYPYWLLAYIIKPAAAKILVEGYKDNLIPCDEWVPRRINQFKCAGFKTNVVSPSSVRESETLASDDGDYILDFNLIPVTVGSEPQKCHRLYTSAKLFNHDFILLGSDVEWKGTDMSGPGGGMKINLLKKFLEDKNEFDVVLFCDGYDVFINEEFETVVRRYLSFNSEIVFAAEQNCWPNPALAENYPKSSTKYRFLNSGLFIGRVGAIRRLINEKSISDSDDDQLYYTHRFLSQKHDIKLDYESYIFQCTDTDTQVTKSDQLYNPSTKCYPCIYHANGAQKAKEFFENIYNSLYSRRYTRIKSYDVIDKDMLLVDFISPEVCDYFIEESERCGEWSSLKYDKFPAQEIRMRTINEKLWEELERHWINYVYPIIEKHWSPMKMCGLRDAFFMKYSMDGQKNLPLHCDASMITGSVKLNDNYEGAELIFPRQNISNKNIPVGKCILFPGMVTHGHRCTDLKSGTKYSLTMWTCRFDGDSI